MFTVVGLSQMAAFFDRSHEPRGRAHGRLLAMFTGLAYQSGTAAVRGMAVGLVAGAAIGALAGWVISATGVNSFVVTLAMDFLCSG